MKNKRKKWTIIIALFLFWFVGLPFPYKQNIVAQRPLSDYEVKQLAGFREIATQGDVEWQYKLARFLSGSSELSQINYDKVIDYTEAAKWFHRAARRGDKTAQYHLAVCYLTGRGVFINIPLAIKWFGIAYVC